MKVDPRPFFLRVAHFHWLLVASMALLGGTGCSAFRGVNDYIAYNDTGNDFVLGYRNTVWSQQAWRAQKACFCDQPYLHSFGEGFRAGYQDVASGGSGCVPALPPRHMWSWKYQTAEGQGKVAAWFAGYPYGARAAAEDGAGNWQEIQVSHLIEMQYSPEFQRGECPPQNACMDCLYEEPGIQMQIQDEAPGADYTAPIQPIPPLDSESQFPAPATSWPTQPPMEYHSSVLQPGNSLAYITP